VAICNPVVVDFEKQLFHFLDPFISIESANTSAATSDRKLARGKPMLLSKIVNELIGTNKKMIIAVVLRRLLAFQLTKWSIVENLPGVMKSLRMVRTS
jgi:hypothetical protein